jgi:NAD(P)-dependent dehydrogenase (short-subunit alcohol dehydrogenase family)
MEFKFINKTYLITGVTSGIGKEICRQLLILGAKVVGLGRDSVKVQDLIEEFPNGKFIFRSFDLKNIGELVILMDSILPDNEKFDGLLLSAGKEETLPISNYTPDKFDSIFQLNVFANAELIRLFSKKKYSNDNSSIVIIASVMSILGQPGKFGYCSTKSALIGMVKSSALELAKRRIRINAISPGVVNTPMTENLFQQLSSENVDKISMMHPLGFGETSDISPLALFLFSDKTRWLTGQNIIIDGGYSIH